MESNYIDIEHVQIKYRTVSGFSIKRNFLKRSTDYVREFEAIKDVSFSVEKGEVIGLVGQNGCGKSSLLRAIAGIYRPNTGSIDLHGHSVSLMSLGVGFMPELTGRENILLSGMLHGIKRKEMEEKIDSIIEFSELEDFIDCQVKTYSSGMYSKLSFSIATGIETDIMLVDEVLSVGDNAFRKKSFEKIKELIEADCRSVIIVSHDEKTLKQFCNRVIWIDYGIVREMGEPDGVLNDYRIEMETRAKKRKMMM